MSIVNKLSEIEIAKNNIKVSLEAKGKTPGNDIRNYAAVINSLNGDIPSSTNIKIIVSETEPEDTAYQGFWVQSSDYTYNEVHIISDRADKCPSSVNIVRLNKNNKYKTVIIESNVSGGLYLDFYEILITDENNEVLWETPIYYGDDTNWVEITSVPAHWTGVTVDYVNKYITRISGSYDINELKCYSNRLRCNINDNGEILAMYGDNNYDPIGSASIHIMVQQPIVYYSIQNIELSSDNSTILKADYIISDGPLPNFEPHPLFIRNNIVYDKVFLNSYDAAVINSKLCSYKGTTPVGGIARPTLRTYAHNRNINWKPWTIQAHNLEILLILIEYASFDYRNNISVGIGYNISQQISGQNYGLDNNGTGRYGSSATVSAAFTYRYRENVWGNMDKCIDNVNIYNNQWFISNSDDFTDDTQNNCITVSNTASSNSGYITKFAYCENAKWLFLPKEVSSNINDSMCQDHYMCGSGWTIIRMGDFYTQPGKTVGNTGLININATPPSTNNGTKMGSGIVCYPQQ